MSNKPVLTLYGRPCCHLCDDMLAALEPLRGEHGFLVKVIDVDTRPEWVARYDEKVPVLTLADKEICHYFLDIDRLIRVLRQTATTLKV